MRTQEGCVVSEGMDNSRRQWPRELAQVPMVFMGTHRRCYSGRTKDVSLGGIALELDQEPSGVDVGLKGGLRLEFEGKEYSYPCSVVRLSGKILFIVMDKSQRAGFASLVSLMQLAAMRSNVRLLERWDSNEAKYRKSASARSGSKHLRK